MRRPTLKGLALALLLCAATQACKRSPRTPSSPPGASVAPAPRDVLCVEQDEGCVYCSGRDTAAAPFLDADQSRPVVCDPKDEEDCVEFCTLLAPECALPWAPEPHCVMHSDLEYQRAVFNRDTVDQPEVQVAGRLVDDGGRRVEGARVDVWVSRGVQQTALAQEVSGKDGTFRLRLRAGPWRYSLRFSRAGLASEIIDRLPAEKLAPASGSQLRVFRLGSEAVIKGRIVESSPGAVPVADAEVSALRAAEEAIESGTARTGDDGTFVLGGLEARRYFLRITKFGWRPYVARGIQAGAGGRATIKLTRATVIRGLVHDKDADPEPNATVAAVLSGLPGVPTTPIFWSSDSTGAFAQDRFAPGTYYLWARKGDMLAYPPEKIELPEGGEVEVDLSLQHKGSRVKGQVVPYRAGAARILPGTRALLVSRSSPLTFPRPAVANVDEGSGRFEFSGLLPGRYEISLREGARSLAIVAGPREVEIPIDADVTVTLKEAITVRPQLAE
ncbi:MAG: carboxypeptidase regulatory-like domain-containing protein [Deltaproteobacteria bacterium]|nr:carboxypeptidase regulatory-like domain-containing protein [Deltaproteobacteria bacterium]